MDAPDEGVLDVDLLVDDGSEEEGDAPPSSGPASTPTSCASSPRGEEPASPHGPLSQPAFFHHQPYTRPFFTSSRRGPGRPRKEGPKLTRDGKIVRRYRGNPGSLRGAKRHRVSRDDSLDDLYDEDDFMLPASEEPPYFPEKWPGKLCALCNLGERSQLGQGEMRRINCPLMENETISNISALIPVRAPQQSASVQTSMPSTPLMSEIVSPPPEITTELQQHILTFPLGRRQKSMNKCKTPLYNMEHTDELSIIGHVELLEVNTLVSNDFLYLHRCCLEFSPPFQNEVASASSSEDDRQSLEEARVKGIVVAALLRKCAFCSRYGASIHCKMSCSKYFHLPCVLASGGFQDFQTKSSFCKDHLYQVPLICSADIDCRTCRVVGDIANLMTCVTCGAHQHGTCVGLAQLPGVRAGWACRSCRLCQVCHSEVAPGTSPAESRAVACEQCDKLYHASCLRPIMATVPKYGWKCKCCRVCSDCGARSPGAGQSSRWHAHYTVCDSCYQQRNKGSCCPLCRRAYRAAAQREMIRCTFCKRYVHGMCDPDAEPLQYKAKKEQNPAYDYVCPMCKPMLQLTGSKNSSLEEEGMASMSHDSSFGDENTQEQDPLALDTKVQLFQPDFGLGKGKPFTVSAKVAKKKIGGYKLKGGFSIAGKLNFQKRQRSNFLDFGRKRGTKPKMRGVFGVPGLGLQRPQAPDNKISDEDPGLENKLVLCSSKDKFVLTQDLCVMCGAIGTDSEGCLIACSQCGQTYHPYCVNIKISKVIVTQGWRCLDCTVCEGCGQRGDEALLVLCDDGDTAWHTYCARPPLQEVPRGSWRCERCRRCLTCGITDTDSWCDDYTECAPCASLVMCCICSEPYSDGELIIQCEPCRRWLHAACDSIRTEQDAEICCQAGYQCLLCRGHDLPPPHILKAQETTTTPTTSAPNLPPPPPTLQSLGLNGEYYMDDVCLSQRGAYQMKQLEAELGITHQRRKRRFKNENMEKDAVVHTADTDNMGEDIKPDSTAEIKDEPGMPVYTSYKEGTLWNMANDGPPPEGFTIYTTESGLTVLRRKRQRNLNKLGIGGFVVRQRQAAAKMQAEEDAESMLPSGESPSNKRKTRRKPRSKLMEQFPSYMQEAFFGKELLEPTKPAVTSTGNHSESPGSSCALRPMTPEGYRELRDFKIDPDNSDSDGEDVLTALTSFNINDSSIIVTLNHEEREILQSLKPKEEKDDTNVTGMSGFDGSVRIKIEGGLHDDGHLKPTEDSTALKNAILGPPLSTEGPPEPYLPPEAIPAVNSTKTEPLSSDTGGSSVNSTMSHKDDLSLLGVNIDAMVRDSLPDMDSTDVDEIFKGVLTDDSQESQESTVSYVNPVSSTPYSQQRPQLTSPMEYTSPYHTEYSSGNSQLSPAFSESCASTTAWSSTEQPTPAPPSTYNQRSSDKMQADESLGLAATISAVLYANTNHPEWKTEFPTWGDRCKQILKKWRALPSDQKAPYLQRARDNRSAIRMKKAQQCGGIQSASVTASSVRVEESSTSVGALSSTSASGSTVAMATPAVTAATTAPEQERACGQQRSVREAEQERQWKQLQQMRQQQTQQQQQIIQDQRIQAMQRIRGPEGEVVEGAPRSAFPAQRFPLHYENNEDINRQLRDLLQRHPEKMWTQQTASDEPGVGVAVNMEGQPFRQPLPVGVRPRPPLPPSQRPDQQLLMQQRLVAAGAKNIQSGPHTHQTLDQKSGGSDSSQPHGIKPVRSSETSGEEMDMGEMDKLEQDTSNIGEVGDILGGLGGEDDEELLDSLTAEIGEEFNILEYADPELAAFNDADTENILDGLELADDGTSERHAKREPEDMSERKPDIKMVCQLPKGTKNIENVKMLKSEIKCEQEDMRGELQEHKITDQSQRTATISQFYSNNGTQRIITQNQIPIQNVKTELKLESEEVKQTDNQEWRGVAGMQTTPQRPITFGQAFGNSSPQRLLSQQIPLQRGGLQQGMTIQRAAQFGPTGSAHVVNQQVIQRPQAQFASGQHAMPFAQGGLVANTTSIVNAMTAQVNAALAAGRPMQPGTRLVGPDGAVGIVRPDHTVALASLPHSGGTVGITGGSRAPPPPPYPGTLRQPQPPPPPYPQNVNQEQPLLLEELLEQEKREQERDGGAEWGSGGNGGTGIGVGAGPAVPPPVPAPPSVPLYQGTAPSAPPPPPDRIVTEADRHVQIIYEQWLQQYNAFAADQLRYYEGEVLKLRKIRKSLNSKQRQLRKSGNELMPSDAAELRRVSTEQAALQKHLEAARKQVRQHGMLMQEYDTKHRQSNPQLPQQASMNQQQQQISNNQTVFAQTIQQASQLQQAGVNKPMQVNLQGTSVQQTTLVRAPQNLLTSDGQQAAFAAQGRALGTLVTSSLQSQGRILQGARTLVIEQANAQQQQQLVRQLSGMPQGDRSQTVGGMLPQFGQQQMNAIRSSISSNVPGTRPAGTRPVMSPLHVQSPHSQSPLHSLAPQSPLHHLASPMQSPLHSQQSPLHHTSQSPLQSSTQSPLHSQQSPLHSQQSPMHMQQTQQSHPQQSPMHPQQSPMHSQQSPMHPQQSPMHVQQATIHTQQSPIATQQSSMHPQQSPLHPQQSPLHPQQSPMHPQQSSLHLQQSPMHSQQSPMLAQQSPMHTQQSPMHAQQSPMHAQQSPMHPQQSPMHPQQSPMHAQQSPMHPQQSPMHAQQSPMHAQQSPMQASMSPQHFLQQLQAQRTSPQLPTPSRSPQIYQQSQILSPVASHSPQLQNTDYSSGRFPRPVPGCSPLPTRFARPPHHQQGMRVGVSFGGRQTSPLGSPQPLPSPGNQASENMTRQQILQRQQYSPMGGAPASPLSRSPHVPRTPTPSASPAASPAPTNMDHGGGGLHNLHMAPIPPGYRYFKLGLFGGAPVWPNKQGDDMRRKSMHTNKVSILKRRTPPRHRFTGKTAAPTMAESDEGTEDLTIHSPHVSPSDTREYVLYSSEGVEYASDTARLGLCSKDDDIEEIIEEHLDDADIVVVEPGAISPEESIATEQDFEELIDSGKPEDENTEEEVHPSEKPAIRTETTTKTVAVISLTTTKQTSSNVQQYKIVNPNQNTTTLSRIPVLSATVLSSHSNAKLHEVSQTTVASVSIANQTISVPVLKSLSVPIGSVSGHSSVASKAQIKKMPINISNQSLNANISSSLSKPISSVISVISSNVNVPKVATLSPVITLATSNTGIGASRVPVSILTQHQVKQKIVKTIEKPMALSLPNSKLSSLSLSQDVTLPAKIFQDEATSPDSTVSTEFNTDKEIRNQMVMNMQITDSNLGSMKKEHGKQDVDIESEISQHTELPRSLCISDRNPLLLGKSDIKSPDPVPEKIPDNIMEGDDEDKPEDDIGNNLILSMNKNISIDRTVHQSNTVSDESKVDVNVVKTIKAIANQTKEMVIDSNMQISSEVPQESVQISIPSPTPSQERYLNHITMQEHTVTEGGRPKQVETIEDMLSMLENIPDDSKMFALKQQSMRSFGKSEIPTTESSSDLGNASRSVGKDVQESVIPFVKNRETERLNLQSATVPQLSPLSQPGELTTNMANVSQQLRTFMSSLNTSKVDTSVNNSSIIRKCMDATTPTQVNFENLLPSSKVEVIGSRPSPLQRLGEKPISSIANMDLPFSTNQCVGSRVNTLSSMCQNKKSPNVSPINSPVSLASSFIKSPAQSPLISNTFSNTEELTGTTSQMIQMPTLSKIQNVSSGSASTMHSSNTISAPTTLSSFQKTQILPTSILGNTLLQPSRQLGTNTIPFNSQNISSSQPPALVMTSRSTSINNKVECASNVTIRTHNILNTGFNQISSTKTPPSLNIITPSTLLHTQLTSPLKRSKSTDEPKSEVIVGHIQPTKRHSVESVIVKSEPIESEEQNSGLQNSDAGGNKLSQTTANQKNDESQNVLLKQLLQTTTTATTVVPSRTMTIQRAAPALGSIPSLEAQLARPSIPPPNLALTQEIEIPKSSPRHLTSRDCGFNSKPIQTVPLSSMSPSLVQSSTQSLMDVRKSNVKVGVKEDTVPLPETSPTIKSGSIFPMNLDQQHIQNTIKKEVPPPQQSPVQRPFTPMDVKKELLDESSQQSAASAASTISDQSKLDQPLKEEFPENSSMDTSEIILAETPSEAKRRKRREYQQKKRKQMQMNMKVASENGVNSNSNKKRPRKGSKLEEDYDTFIDNLMVQLRLLPPMQIQEPALTTNFAVSPLFGTGDLLKLKNKDYDILKGDLIGEFGNARIPNSADYYNTKPFGDEEPLPEKPAASTQRGFYDQEFQPIAFEDDIDDKKLDFICKERDTDTPDSIVSCSSPESFDIDSLNRFPGLKLIEDDEEDDDSDSGISGRISPVIPIIAPVPIRIKPVLYQLKEDDDTLKPFRALECDSVVKSKMLDSPNGSENNENVTVTLTLTSGAAEDILGVLKELAGILQIPPPTSYQIIERTATPPSHKLGLYRSKGRDGKEGTPIDIQSILNGAAKFCRHCDVVILDSVVRAKASEFPLLSSNKGSDEDILRDSDAELYFCSTQCYERFSWRPTNIILDGKPRNIKDDKSDAETNISKDKDDFETASTESMETDDLDIKPDIKDEKMDLSFMDSLDNDELMKEVGDDVSALDEDMRNVDQDERKSKTEEHEKYRGFRYKAWAPGCIGPPVRYKRPTDRELAELVFRTGVAIMPVTTEDTRRCELCGIQGDGVADGVSRLLNCDVDRWVHLNCALWSEGVYETVSGALVNVETALAAGANATCAVCRRLGATVRCFKVRCGSVYHLGCAVKDNCVFYKNKTAFCASHAPKGEKDNELTTLSVQRRVYVSRDEQRQVASVMLHSDTNHLIRVGGLIFLSPGHLLPHQLAAFHTPNYIYPVGYKIVRFYWSMRRANSRCRYVCWISDEEGRPRFHVQPQDEGKEEMFAPTARAAWAKVLDAVAALREQGGDESVLKLWPNYVTGEDLFGLTEPTVVRVLESLPGIETLTDYRFKFGRSALLEGGLTVNPSGCARCEPRHRTTWRRPPRSLVPSTPAGPSSVALDLSTPTCPYSKQFVHTKSSQYKKMKLEWRNNVYLARSKIQGLGLYAARDLEKHTMVIEYIGEIIRSELSEIREKQYEDKNRGIYMFRLDERRVVDATLSGGLARYINHSCQPNCVAETVEVDRDLRIIIFAKRRIARGEEFAYDYKFDIEDDAHKIMCMCGAPNCRKWMN